MATEWTKFQYIKVFDERLMSIITRLKSEIPSEGGLINLFSGLPAEEGVEIVPYPPLQLAKDLVERGLMIILQEVYRNIHLGEYSYELFVEERDSNRGIQRATVRLRFSRGDVVLTKPTEE